jgi:hypothetical protein
MVPSPHPLPSYRPAEQGTSTVQFYPAVSYTNGVSAQTLPQQRFHHRLDGHLDFEQSIGGCGEPVWAVLGLQHGLNHGQIHLAERGMERVDHVRQLRHGIGALLR